MRKIYWKPEGKAKWKLIRAKNTDLEDAISKGAKYKTVAQFTLDDNGKPSCYFGPLYFDLDAKNMVDAIADARTLIKKLEENFKYPKGAAKIYLSGGRGFHIELPAVTFGAENGDPNLPGIFKLIAEDFHLPSIDLKVYNLGEGRMWRLPNLKRGNGCYKVPLTVEELFKLKVTELVELTKSPRQDFNHKDPIEFPVCDALKAEFLRKKEEYYWQKENSKYAATPSSKIQTNFKSTLPSCIRAVLNIENLENTSGTNFNALGTSMASFYVSANIKSSVFLEDMDSFCDLNFHDSKHYQSFEAKQKHLAEQFVWVSKNPRYFFSCGMTKSQRNNKVISFTCEKCPLDETVKNKKTSSDNAYTLIDANELLKLHVDRLDPIIEEIVPSRAIIIISGDTGVGKSLLVHSLSISVALGMDEFLGFRIRKPHEVLYVNLELNMEYVKDRHKKLTDHIFQNIPINSPFRDRLDNLKINKIDKNTILFESQWDRITTTLKMADPPFDLVVIDNLYASTNEDEEKNYRLKPLLGKINQVRHDHECSIILVTHHSKRHTEDKSIQLRMIRGGSTLVNFADVVIQMAKSNLVEGLRLFKLTKERGGGSFEDIPLGIFLNPDTLWFKNTGVIDSEFLHMSPPGKSDMQTALDAMDDTFESKAFVEYVIKELNKSQRTAKYWMKKLADRHQIKHLRWGKYEKVTHDMV